MMLEINRCLTVNSYCELWTGHPLSLSVENGIHCPQRKTTSLGRHGCVPSRLGFMCHLPSRMSSFPSLSLFLPAVIHRVIYLSGRFQWSHNLQVPFSIWRGSSHLCLLWASRAGPSELLGKIFIQWMKCSLLVCEVPSVQGGGRPNRLVWEEDTEGRRFI